VAGGGRARPRGSRGYAGDRQVEGADFAIEPWDYLYYAEKVRKAKYDLDQGELKPYFELDNMIAGAFWMAGELYGLSFTEIPGKVPVFSPDVRVWEVTDKASGKYVGLFYGDYFAVRSSDRARGRPDIRGTRVSRGRPCPDHVQHNIS